MRLSGMLVIVLFWIGATYAVAKGVAAGTIIENQAYIYYQNNGKEINASTNVDMFVVDQVVDVDIAWQDSDTIEVGSGEKHWLLTFLLSNLGNGEDNITLIYEHNETSGFTPLNPQIFYDSDRDGVFDATKDIAVTDINLSADSNATLFLVVDIPDENFTGGEVSYDGIVAQSSYTVTTDQEVQEEVDIVLRTSKEFAQGAFRIRDYWLESNKYAVVHSEDNATHTGSIITYTIELFIGGNADGREVRNITVEDTIPSGTRYVPSSLRLEDESLTDAEDTDAGSSDARKVRVEVGTIRGNVHKYVSFDVQVL